ncbi:MAG: hypothetical protein Kow0040_28450 [Thermogutta sp.]
MQQFQDMPDSATLERIVREVLAALGAETPEGGANDDGATATKATTPSAPIVTEASPTTETRKARIVSTRDGELSIPERVVTASVLDGRLQGIRRLLVRPGAILTPAVRDLLRQQGIVVTYGPVSTSVRPAGGPGTETSGGTADRAVMPVILVTRRISPAQVSGLFRAGDVRVAPEELDCVVRASQRAAETVRRPGGRVVIVTSHVAAGVCLANRLEGVRAVAGRRPNEVTIDAAAVGANVLVADARQGVFQIKRMIAEFARSPLQCPEAFARHLS